MRDVYKRHITGRVETNSGQRYETTTLEQFFQITVRELRCSNHFMRNSDRDTNRLNNRSTTEVVADGCPLWHRQNNTTKPARLPVLKDSVLNRSIRYRNW